MPGPSEKVLDMIDAALDTVPLASASRDSRAVREATDRLRLIAFIGPTSERVATIDVAELGPCRESTFGAPCGKALRDDVPRVA